MNADTRDAETSIDHLPEERRERLRTITQALVGLVPLEFLILFGSHARDDWVEDRKTGYTSDFDFLVVVESETTANLLLVFTAYKLRTHDLEELGQRIERACPEVAGALPREGSEEDERLFGLLRRAYIDARYSKSYRITQEELRELDRRVRELALRIRKSARRASSAWKDSVARTPCGRICSGYSGLPRQRPPKRSWERDPAVRLDASRLTSLHHARRPHRSAPSVMSHSDDPPLLLQ